MTTTTRRQSLATLLPDPTTSAWGVWLHFENGYGSDKEYRIVVDGATTMFQWGRRDAGGQTQILRHATPAAAVKAAMKQWSAKEAKGYWPISGILPLEVAPGGGYTDGDRIVWILRVAYANAVQQLTKARVGSRLWLCQAPSWDAPGGASAPLLTLATRGGVAGGRTTLEAGSYFLVAITDSCGPLLTAVCPVAVELGPKRDEDTQTVAQIASVLAGEVAAAESAREALAAALDAARAIIA